MLFSNNETFLQGVRTPSIEHNAIVVCFCGRYPLFYGVNTHYNVSYIPKLLANSPSINDRQLARVDTLHPKKPTSPSQRSKMSTTSPICDGGKPCFTKKDIIVGVCVVFAVFICILITVGLQILHQKREAARRQEKLQEDIEFQNQRNTDALQSQSAHSTAPALRNPFAVLPEQDHDGFATQKTFSVPRNPPSYHSNVEDDPEAQKAKAKPLMTSPAISPRTVTNPAAPKDSLSLDRESEDLQRLCGSPFSDTLPASWGRIVRE